MSNTTTKVLDLIPDSLKPQLLQEVAELLDQQKKEQEKKKSSITITPEQIDELVKSIM